jgi:hypothetical protein
MKSTRLLLRLAALALLGSPPALAQSPWTQAHGDGYLQLSAYMIRYDELYRSSGPDFRTSREITDGTLEAYGEFGLTDDLTLIGRVPFMLQDAGDPVSDPSLPLSTSSGSYSAFGNLGVGLRHRWIDDGFTLAGQLDLQFPTGSFDDESGLNTGYDAFTFEPRVSIGKGFDRAYLFGYGGFGLRTDDFSNFWRIGAEGGYTFFDRLTLAAFTDVLQSFEDGDVELPAANLETGLYVNDQEWVAIGVKGLFDITDSFGLQATVHGAASGNNVPKAPLIGFGVYLRL